MGRARKEKRLATASCHLIIVLLFLVFLIGDGSATFGVGEGFHGIGVTAGDEKDSFIGI